MPLRLLIDGRVRQMPVLLVLLSLGNAVGMLLAGKELTFGNVELLTESPTAGTPCQLPHRDWAWKEASLEKVHAANCQANRQSRHKSFEEEALLSNIISVCVQFKLILQQLPALQPDYWIIWARAQVPKGLGSTTLLW